MCKMESSEIEKKMVSNTSGKSQVWKVFGFYQVDGKIEKEKVVCKICKAEYKYFGELTFNCQSFCQVCKLQCFSIFDIRKSENIFKVSSSIFCVGKTSAMATHIEKAHSSELK